MFSRQGYFMTLQQQDYSNKYIQIVPMQFITYTNICANYASEVNIIAIYIFLKKICQIIQKPSYCPIALLVHMKDESILLTHVHGNE